MPKEVADIKKVRKFYRRRVDCVFIFNVLIFLSSSSSRSAVARTLRVRIRCSQRKGRPGGEGKNLNDFRKRGDRMEMKRISITNLFSFSRADQEEQEGPQHQVQGPMPEAPLHPGAQGQREGREA
jgi:hypothetical protein